MLHDEDIIGGCPIFWTEVVDFNNCLFEAGLIELPMLGNRYSWNDKGVDKRIFSKIDWIFINDMWLDNMPTCRAILLPEGISDHCPIKVSLAEENPRRKRSFQYCNTWSHNPQFVDLVREERNTSFKGCKMFKVVKKLKSLKKKLKLLNSDCFSNIINEANEDRKILKEAQQ